jgi:multiple sugar transport system substrate-binding protein
VTDNSQIRSLFMDAMTGKINRREIFKRGAAIGVGAAALTSLVTLTSNGALAATEGTLTVTYYDWIQTLHPTLDLVNKDFEKTYPINAQVAPTAGFGFDRFVTEAKSQTSTWDMYMGVTPFLEMIALAESGTIEPWDPYLPAGILDDLPDSIRLEGMYQATTDTAPKFYVWPWFFDVISQAWHSGIVEKAGLDPEKAPANWDEFLANAKKVKDSGAAPYGCTYDFHDWRSLIPITHSISTDVYTPDGLFDYTSDAAAEALEIMKQMFELANPDDNNEGTTDGGVNNTPDEQVFSAEQVGYYIKYVNAPVRFASNWTDPKKLRIAPLPVKTGGAGGTVFWNTGSVLFKYGKNKQQAAEYVKAQGYDQRVWQESIAGYPDLQSPPVGQLPPYKSIYAAWAANPPQFIKDNPWVPVIFDSLSRAKAIEPTIIAASQFTVARPEWVKYLNGGVSTAKEALQNAANAVYAEWKKQTGKDAQMPVHGAGGATPEATPTS